MILANEGRVLARTLKRELPNYGTFDEKRIFTPGPMPEPIEFKGVKIGVPICEDIWQETVCGHLADAGAEMLLVPNGSPYELDKDDLRQALVKSRCAITGLPIAYVNRVGGQDELVFDGSSFVMHPDGEVVVQMPDWEECLLITDWERGDDGWRCATRDVHRLDPYPEDIYHAMMVGLADYVGRNGFPGVMLGLSGGIDSALSAAVAVDALGADKVWGVMMPSKYTSDDSLEDARGCADLLGCRHDVIPIAPAVEAFDSMLSDAFEGTESGLAEENIQARLRMVVLMALSNKFGPMLLTTGNKSEMSVGYATLYGDMAGGYSVLKDAYKTTVFKLSEWRNANKPKGARGPDGPVMPARVITKPPSAELRPDQTDQDSLPPYDVLDAILEGLVDKEMSVNEVAARHRSGNGAHRRHRAQAAPRRIQAASGAAGSEDRRPQLRPRPPLPDQQLLPKRHGMTVVTRFAPSPTGRLHVGNIRTALHNFLFALKNGGEFVLRIDDTDRARSTAQFDQAIRDDLDWLGLDPTRVVRQSERFDLYEGEFEKLRESGRVYACYETPEELELRRKVLLGRGLPPVYERKPAGAPIPEGRSPHWRFQTRPRPADRVDRPHPRPAEIRSELAQRPGRSARGRKLAVFAAERDRRHRSGDHAHRSRRRPCLQQRRPDPDVRGAWVGSAEVRARSAFGRRRGEAFEAARVDRGRGHSRSRPGADGTAVGAGENRDVAAGGAGAQPRGVGDRLRLCAFRACAGALRPARG